VFVSRRCAPGRDHRLRQVVASSMWRSERNTVGGVPRALGPATFNECSIHNNVAVGTAWDNIDHGGGGVAVASGSVTFNGYRIVKNQAPDSHGGGVLNSCQPNGYAGCVAVGAVNLTACEIHSNAAMNASGIHNVGELYLFKTRVFDNAPHNIFNGANLTGVLPTVLGYHVDGVFTRGEATCPEIVGGGLMPCPSQSCNYTLFEGASVVRVSQGYLANDWPSPCARGFFANSTAVSDQDSALCSGTCPAAHFCPDEPTLRPVACPNGTYSGARGAIHADECNPCSIGHYCVQHRRLGIGVARRPPHRWLVLLVPLAVVRVCEDRTSARDAAAGAGAQTAGLFFVRSARIQTRSCLARTARHQRRACRAPSIRPRSLSEPPQQRTVLAARTSSTTAPLTPRAWGGTVAQCRPGAA
jgi:hypothetical protein